jgi:hypothetical protein
MALTGPGGRENELNQFRTSNMRPNGLLGPDGQPIPVRIESADQSAFPWLSAKRDTPQGESSGFAATLTDQKAIAATVRQVADELRVAADMAKQFQMASQQALTAQRQETRESTRQQREQLDRTLKAIQDALTRDSGSGLSTSSPTGPGEAPRGRHRAQPRPGDAPRVGDPAEHEIPDLDTPEFGGRPASGGSGGGSPPGGGPPPAPPAPPAPPGPPSGSPPRGPGGGPAPTRMSISHALINNLGRVPQVTRMARPFARAFAHGGLGSVATRAMPLLRAAPGLGTAVMAGEIVNDTLEGTTEQVRKNAQYQSMLGGSNFEGLGQRVQEQGYVWGNRLNAFGGGLAEEDARQAFQGVTSLGLRDSERGNALKLVEKNYADLGMDVQSSLKLLEMSAKGANLQFGGLEKSLKSVSLMARATGQNANVLYESFAKNYQLALGMSLGPQAASVAAGMTAATSGMSRDLEGVDTSGQSSYFYKRRLSQLSGMTYGQLETQAARGNTTPLTQAQDRDRTQTASRALQAQGRGAYDLLQQRMREMGGGQKLADSPAELQRVAQDLLMTGIDPQSMKAYMESYGGYKFDANMSDQQITEAFAGWVADPSRGTRGTEAAKAQVDQKDLDLLRESGTKLGYGFMGLGFNEGASEYVRKNYALNPFSSEGVAKNEVLDAYSAHQYQSAKSDPVIEQFIDRVGNRSEIGVEVQTGKGTRVVDQADAIKYYSDQVARGTARFSGGDPDLDGKAIKDVIGSERNVDPKTDSTKDDTERGTSPDQWKKDHPTSASEAKDEQGKVTISLQPGLEKIFNIQTEGAAITDAGAAAGVPPVATGSVPR